MKDLKSKTINYKEIVISEKFIGQYQVTCFDVERQKTTYNNCFKTLSEAEECFNDLVEIQEEKMCHQF